MKRRLRIAIPGLLVPLSAVAIAGLLLLAGGIGSIFDDGSDPQATPSSPFVDAADRQRDVLQWWIAAATAGAPSPTPTLTPTPWPSPYDVAAAELPTAVAPQAIAFASGERWIAVSLSTQRAYGLIGDKVQHVALVTTGMAGFETRPGEYRINYRKQNETMDSATIGIPRDDPVGYYLTDVLWTQYFYPTVALHANYWQPISVFGHTASSHGCVGMLENDAKWFWDFASYGTRVVVY